MSMQLTIQNISKRFNREWIFKNLSYTFKSGNTYAITGPNGAGKSTLLQVLWGQMPPTSGSLSYTHLAGDIAIEDVYQHIAIATPYMELIDEFTLIEQLNFHFKLKKIRSGFTLDKIIDIIYLDQARGKQIANFSSGMKQRLKLALAFFTESKIIFLDEPGTNLDKKAFDWYLTWLNSLIGTNMIFIASNQQAEYPDNAIKIDISNYK